MSLTPPTPEEKRYKAAKNALEDAENQYRNAETDFEHDPDNNAGKLSFRADKLKKAKEDFDKVK